MNQGVDEGALIRIEESIRAYTTAQSDLNDLVLPYIKQLEIGLNKHRPVLRSVREVKTLIDDMPWPQDLIYKKKPIPKPLHTITLSYGYQPTHIPRVEITFATTDETFYYHVYVVTC